MENEFLPYELAVKLKALGFNEPCFGYYYTLNGKDWKFAEKTEYWKLDDEINIGGKFTLLAPTFSQAFRWFRDDHSIYGIIIPSYADSKVVKDRFFYEIANAKKLKQELEYHATYEEAELACLTKLIEIAEGNGKEEML
jgi:hypothetical protein